MIKLLTGVAIGVIEWLANRPTPTVKKDTARAARDHWEQLKAERAKRHLDAGGKL